MYLWKIEKLKVWEENMGELSYNVGVRKAFVSKIEAIRGKKLIIQTFKNFLLIKKKW